MTLVTLLFLFCFCGFSSTFNSTLKICKTSNGDSGRCVNKNFCSFSTEKCTENTVCCPMSMKIMTPNDTPVQTAPPVVFTQAAPPAQTSYQPTQGPVQVTTRSSGGSGFSPAVIKCAEYKAASAAVAPFKSFIIGGTPSAETEFPHMALLGYGSPSAPKWLCGGSLISDFYVVTAAHCLLTDNVGTLVTVRLGELDLTRTTDADPHDFDIAAQIVHPNYKKPSQYNDIALIRLNRQVQFTRYIAPICLETTKNLPSTKFIATGWGRTDNGYQSNVLMKVNLEYFDSITCQNNYKDVPAEYLARGIDDNSQICAGSRTDNKDTCQGDSGGPLQIDNGGLTLVGLTSFGKACGIANSPAVYTKISFFLDWIEAIVWP